jgi:molybdenum cofactor cytidylyltransferase
MPFVSTRHLRNLIGRFDVEHTPIVASSNDKVAMPPALFARALFEKLQSGEGDRGGKTLLADAALVHAGSDELADIDCPSDLPE